MSIYRWNFLLVVAFVYFLTLSGDQLHFQVFFFKPKVTHCIATFIFALLFFSSRIYLPDRKIIWCFLGLLSSLLVSALFSPFFSRSAGYVLVAFFTFAVYFLVPLALMHFLDEERVLRIYKLSFLVIGGHAALQLFLSVFKIYDPFIQQQTFYGAFARGQSWTYEPSYYALYAIPFIVWLNTEFLLSTKQEKKLSSSILLFLFNFFLLSSTSTSAFFSYFVFFLSVFFFFPFRFRKIFFPGLYQRSLKFLGAFFLLFCGMGFFLRELFLETFYKFFHVGFFSHLSFFQRWNGIVEAWNVFLDHPFFGVGIGGVGPLLYLQHQGSAAAIGLHQPTLEMIEPFDPTNVFTEMLASLGGYGLCVFFLIGAFFWRIFMSALNKPDIAEEKRKTIFSLLVSVVVMLICLQFNQGLFRNYVWVHMGISLGYVLKSNCYSCVD